MTIKSCSWLKGISTSGEHTDIAGVGSGRVAVGDSVVEEEALGWSGCGVLLEVGSIGPVRVGTVVPGMDVEPAGVASAAVHAAIRDMSISGRIRSGRRIMG